MCAPRTVAIGRAFARLSQYVLCSTTIVLAAFAPSRAAAAGIVFEPRQPGETAAWKTVNPGAGDGSQGYWDGRSYDSHQQVPAGACTAAALIGGVACDWRGFPEPAPGDPYQTIATSKPADPNQPLSYFGLTNPATMPDAPLDFFFSGPFEFDPAVLFQLSAWDDTVEFGWYEAGNPNARTPIFGPGGPFTDNLGGVTGGPNVAIPATDFGFYYVNSRYVPANATSAERELTEIAFFTQSRFNRLGRYYDYFFDPDSGLDFGTSLTFREDEFPLIASVVNRQQFNVFRQGGRYWLALEDQLGTVTPAFCRDRALQPCSDYDYNDLIIDFEERNVPEPALLTLLAAGLFGLAWTRRRRH